MKSQFLSKKYFRILVYGILLTFGFLFIRYSWKNEEKKQKDCMLQNALNCGLLLHNVDLNQLNAKPGDKYIPQYYILKQILKEIVRVNKDVRFAYVWKERSGKIYFVADSEPDTSSDISPTGQEYVEAKPEDLKPFYDGKNYITPMLKDKWGTWKSIYIPIKDSSTKKPIAVFGIDINARIWYHNILFRIIDSSLLTVLILILFVIFFRIYTKNKNLKIILDERHKAEKALINSEQKFKNLVETSSDIIWETNDKGQYTYLSPQVKDVLGYEPSELIGKTPFENMPDDEAKRIIEISDDIVKCRRIFENLENSTFHKDGHLVILETSGVPIIDKDGGLKGYRGVDCDITQRKQNENLLYNSNNKLTKILEVAGEGIIGVNDKGIIIFANPMAEKLLGYEKDEMLGKHSHTLFHHSYPDGKHFPGIECPNYSTLKFGKNIVGEDYYWKKDRTGFFVSYSSSSFQNDEGNTGIVITFIDITVKREAEEFMRLKTSELERFNKLLVNRELKMVELKKEVNELLNKSGKPEKYKNRMD